MRTIHYLLILLCYAHIVKVMAQVVEFHGSLWMWSWAQCSTMLNIIIFQPEFNKGSSVNYLSPLSVIKTLNLFFSSLP